MDNVLPARNFEQHHVWIMADKERREFASFGGCSIVRGHSKNERATHSGVAHKIESNGSESPNQDDKRHFDDDESNYNCAQRRRV